eukprot:5762016-Alexandrium_andersonii.AAC.1
MAMVGFDRMTSGGPTSVDSRRGLFLSTTCAIVMTPAPVSMLLVPGSGPRTVATVIRSSGSKRMSVTVTAQLSGG